MNELIRWMLFILHFVCVIPMVLMPIHLRNMLIKIKDGEDTDKEIRRLMLCMLAVWYMAL